MRSSFNRAARKGIAGIVGAILFLGIISTVIYTYVNVQYDTNQQLENTVSARVLKDVEQQNEDFRLGTMFLSDNETIGFVVHNTGQGLINVVAVFVHESSGEIANKSDSSKAVFNGNPLFSVAAGTSSSVYNTTVLYPENQNAKFIVRILTDKANIGSATFPELQIAVAEVQALEEAIEGVTTRAIGQLLLNFSSFEVCVPNPPVDNNCEPSSTDWVGGWEVNKNDEILFRITIRNTGNTTYFMSEHTVLSGLGPMGVSSSINSYVFHIKEPPTVADDNGLPYNPDFGISISGGSNTTLYFGANIAGGDQLEKFPLTGLFWTVFVIFGYEDVNENGTYESGIDTTPYSQALPFVAGLSAL